MYAIPIRLAERGFVPDWAVRAGIRTLLRRRIRTLDASAGADRAAYVEEVSAQLRRHAIAEATQDANRQHYELPAEFFTHMLGPRMKYSSCYFSDQRKTLDEAESDMLDLTCRRADILDGMAILELGCGWGSLTLWMAEQYPTADITAVTNSGSQADYVRMRARNAGVQDRVKVVESDINAFSTDLAFDRIVSVEMFEHVRNYQRLFERLHTWLRPEGKLFVHIFSHRSLPYVFETEGEENWMGRYFFTGGTMPSHDLLPRFAEELLLSESWRVNGLHYTWTLESWLDNLDHSRSDVIGRLEEFYGAREARVWFYRWRMFLMACSELFAFRGGEEWGLSHLLFQRS